MNALTFEIKQVHIRATAEGVARFKEAAVRWKKPMLADMTPARFDIMQAVYLFDEPAHQRRAAAGKPAIPRLRPMAGLIKILGRAASTVSLGVKRLAEIGWVQVRRRAYDRRIADVYLTADGLEALALAKACLEWEPRDLPGFVPADERPLAERAEGRGINVRTRALVKIDRVAEAHAEDCFGAWLRAGGDKIGFAEVMNHHFFRVVDHIARIGRFFGAKARPLHDPRDESTFELHVEDYVPDRGALARRGAFPGAAYATPLPAWFAIPPAWARSR